MRILGISGSLRAASTNTCLLRAARELAPADVEFRLTSNIGRLPLFSPDANVTEVDLVDLWAQEVRAADGIVISTPEYAGGYPGALKNAFDWLVGTDAHINKPFMLLNASARSIIAQNSLSTVLETMAGVHMKSASTTIPLLGTKMDAAEIVRNAELANKVRTALQQFVSDIKRHAITTFA